MTATSSSTGRIVLVTGVSGVLGGRLARRVVDTEDSAEIKPDNSREPH